MSKGPALSAMKLSRYSAERAHQWNDFVKTSKNGFFMFDRGYMDYHADRFTDHSLMFYDEQDKLVTILPANARDGVLYSHQGLTFGGFITGKSMRADIMLEAMDALLAYARAEGFSKIIYKAIPFFYHKQPAQEDLYALFRAGAQCYRVDISSTLSYGQQRYAFSSSRKSGLKKAGEHDLRLTESDDFDTFFAMLNNVLNEKYKTNATHTAAEMALLHGRFPKNIRLHACFEGDEMVAGILVYEAETTAHTQYIASSDRGKEIGAPDFILNELISTRYANKNYFDFGISTEEGGRVLNTGLISQKEGAGARGTIHQFFEIDLTTRS